MRKLLLLVLPLLFILAGCMSEEERLVGKWRGSVDLSSTLQSSPAGATAKGFASMVEPQLDLRPDKTFALSISFAPIEGMWKLQGKEIILTPKTVMGMSAAKVQEEASRRMDHSPIPMPFGMGGMPNMREMKVQILGNGDKLSLDPAAGSMMAGFGKMTFTKV